MAVGDSDSGIGDRVTVAAGDCDGGIQLPISSDRLHDPKCHIQNPGNSVGMAFRP